MNEILCALNEVKRLIKPCVIESDDDLGLSLLLLENVILSVENNNELNELLRLSKLRGM